MKIHKVLYNGGDQTIAHIPHDESGRPIRITSATYSIVDLRYSEESSERVVDSGNVTTDALSSAITAAAGPSQENGSLITIASVTSYVNDHPYMISGLAGTELFWLERKDATNNRLYTRHPLRHDYPATTTNVQSCEIFCTFPSAEAASEQSIDDLGGPYAVIWTYNLHNHKYIVSEQIFIERYSERPVVMASEVIQAYPSLALRVREIARIEDAIAVATDDFLAEIEASGRKPAYFKTSRAGKMAIRNKALEYILRWQQTEQDNENAAVWAEKYQSLMTSILNGVPPETTVAIDPVNADAPAGTNKSYGMTLIRRS